VNPLANQTFANPVPHGAREVPGPAVRLRALANKKSLAINAKLGRQEARDYSNLGLVYWSRGEFDLTARTLVTAFSVALEI
jgi:hypothetical protein